MTYLSPSQKAFLCGERLRDAATGHDVLCDWEVIGSDVEEVLLAAREHARRCHGIDLTLAQLRARLSQTREPIHARVRGI